MDRAKFQPLEASAHKTSCVARAGARKPGGNLKSSLLQRPELASVRGVKFHKPFFFFFNVESVSLGESGQGDLLKLLPVAEKAANA